MGCLQAAGETFLSVVTVTTFYLRDAFLIPSFALHSRASRGSRNQNAAGRRQVREERLAAVSENGITGVFHQGESTDAATATIGDEKLDDRRLFHRHEHAATRRPV